MKRASVWISAVAGCAVLAGAVVALGADWPQWRGPNRDGKATGFTAPATWPKALTKVWNVAVGAGDATPAVVGEKVYVFTREGEEEVTRCLNLKDGSEVWKDKYATAGVTGADRGHAGPRSTPAVADGKVVCLGVNGVLSCLDAEKGALVWRKDTIKTTPKFHVGMSPLVVDGMVVAFLGSETAGALTAFDLAKGDEKWKWTDEGPHYGSPVVMTVEGVKQVVTLTVKSLVGVGLADGKLLWKVDFPVTGMAYNADTPIVDGQTVIFSGQGRGTQAVKIEKKESGFVATPVWKNPEASIQFAASVLKDGQVYGLTSGGRLFCLNASDGKTAWLDTTARGGSGGMGGRRGGRGMGTPSTMSGGGGRGGMGGGGGSGYGGIVDAGSVILALAQDGTLVVFKPNAAKFEEVAQVKVAEGQVYAQPVPLGTRLLIKDANSVTLFGLEEAPAKGA